MTTPRIERPPKSGSSRRLRVCIDARLAEGAHGGIEQVVIGLASGLSGLEPDGDEFVFAMHEGDDAWLRPYVHGPCRIALRPRAHPSDSTARRVRSRIGSVAPGAVRAWRWAKAGLSLPKPPLSDGFVEREAFDVVHFVSQAAFLTSVPSVYHPHDLQHVHLPQFFSRHERALREAHYGAFCRQASEVVVTSRWTRDDVISHFGLDPARVSIVPWAPVVTAYPEPSAAQLDEARARLRLPERFVLFPAQTWPHKNHARLLESLALLRRDCGLVVPFVSSGSLTPHHRELERLAESLGLANHVRWLGFVSPIDLQCLYRLTTAVVIPTRFEAASGPLWEAFASGVPAACSNVTSLPEQAGDAALVFDPDDTHAIADAIASLWNDASLREELVRRGRINVGRFSWDRTARMFRAHYRRVAGVPLAEADAELLAAPALV